MRGRYRYSDREQLAIFLVAFRLWFFARILRESGVSGDSWKKDIGRIEENNLDDAFVVVVVLLTLSSCILRTMSIFFLR